MSDRLSKLWELLRPRGDIEFRISLDRGTADVLVVHGLDRLARRWTWDSLVGTWLIGPERDDDDLAPLIDLDHLDAPPGRLGDRVERWETSAGSIAWGGGPHLRSYVYDWDWFEEGACCESAPEFDAADAVIRASCECCDALVSPAALTRMVVTLRDGGYTTATVKSEAERLCRAGRWNVPILVLDGDSRQFKLARIWSRT